MEQDNSGEGPRDLREEAAAEDVRGAHTANAPRPALQQWCHPGASSMDRMCVSALGLP